MAAVTSAVVAGVGVASSAYNSSRARSQARDAQRSQDAAIQAQIDLQRGQMEEGNRRYGQWESMFMPGFSALRDAAFEEVRPDFEAIDADVGSAFDQAQGMRRRQMERFGIRPTDGAADAAEREYGIGRALATVQGRNSARQTARNEQWNRLAGFTNSGNALYGGANQMIGAAYAGLNSAFGNQANAANQRWQVGNNQANSWMQDAASWAGWGINSWQNRQQTPAAIPISPVERGGGG